MNINNNHFSSIRQVQETYFQNQPGISRKNSETAASFQEILKQKSEAAGTENKPLKFSRHADARMADRNISLTKEQLDRLEQGTKKADEKGIRESLVIMDNLYFIVNIKNRTVITAMDQSENEENVYTNIDGAVII